MKRTVAMLLVFGCLGPLKAQYDFDAVERNRMAKAGVKTQTQWTHEYVDGKPSAKGYRSSVTKYNTGGNIVEVVNYNEEGKIILLNVYQYDSKGNRINFERYQGNREKQQYSQKTVYDAKGNKTGESGYNGAATYRNDYRYDNAGKLVEITYTENNAPVEKRKLSYSGNKTEIRIFDADNHLTFMQENTFNAKGSLVSEVKTGGSGNVMHTLDLQYNTEGNLLEETKKRGGEKPEYQRLYYYDSDNRPVKEESVNLDGTKYVSHEYQYNNLGDLIFESWKKNNRAKEPTSKKLTYDSKGLYTDAECYFATYKLYSLYKYTYEFY